MRPLIISFVLLATTANLCAAQEGPAAPDHSHDGHEHAPGAHDADERDDNKATTYFWIKSDEAFHAGDYERVLRLHKAIVAIDPQDTQSYGVYAWIAWSMDNHKEATDHIERGLKANPENWEMWEVAGQQYQFMKLWPQAQNAFSRAVQLAPKDENIMILRRQLAHVSQSAGDLQTSVETWRALVKDYPSDPVNKNNLERVEKLIAEKAKAGTKTSRLDKGRLVASAGLFGGLLAPALLYTGRTAYSLMSNSSDRRA